MLCAQESFAGRKGHLAPIRVVADVGTIVMVCVGVDALGSRGTEQVGYEGIGNGWNETVDRGRG